MKMAESFAEIRSQEVLPSTAAKNRFAGKVAIVTGGASGIGKATVERLAIEGASVAIFDINQEAGERVSSELCSLKFNVTYYNVDVSDKIKCVENVQKVAEANSGNVHYLVNCAAYFGCKSLTAEKKDWDKSFGVNVVGYSNMVQACHGYMSKIQGDKSIVNIASVSAHRVQPQHWTYSGTKGAILMMTKCMALDLSQDKIRVNSVSPGWVWGPEVAKAAADGGKKKWEPIWGSYHMPKRLAETTEIASAICFLLSEDASFITATDLPVDGGYCSMGPEGLGENSNFAGADY